MARRIESLLLPGPAGKIEAILEEPDDGEVVETALVCHPHPKFGGTMHNKVVYRLARGLRRTGCAVLRFNFRGVNLSEGEYDEGIGETEDARAALRELEARYPEIPVLAAGFSFGARVALRLAASEPSITRVVAAGFPTRILERNFVYHIAVPKFFVHSTHDEFGPRADFEPFFASVPEPKHLDWIEADDHFFKNALDELERVVERIALGRNRPYADASAAPPYGRLAD
jgi:alpha/beta superfamily hydrolase